MTAFPLRLLLSRSEFYYSWNMLKLVAKAAASYSIRSNISTVLNRFVGRSDNNFLEAGVSLYAWAYQQLDHFSGRELRKLQLRKLEKILWHAADSVPHWRKLFDRTGFDPLRFSEQDFWSRIPPMTREDVQKLPLADLLSTAVSPERRVSASTSGSTGEPLSFSQDLREIPLRSAVAFLAMHYMGFARKKPVFILGRSGPHLRLIGEVISGVSLESETFRERTLYPILKSRRPGVILGTASYLLRFMHYLERDKVPLPLHGLISTGEELSRENRSKLEEFFGCPIGSLYATNECAVVGITCSSGRFHCLPFLNYVEIVDERGAPCPEGKKGEIAVTSFENAVMPFIRYKIGDEGVLEQEPCDCGRKSKTIKFLGRIPTYIHLGEKRLNVRFLELLLADICRGMKKFQIVQTGPNTIAIHYLPNGEVLFDEHAAAATIGKTLCRHLGMTGKLDLSLKKVAELLPNPQGKTPIFVAQG